MLARGNGPTVRAGDLVYARVRVARPNAAPLPAEPEVFNAWIWSGASPYDDDPRVPDRDTWADVGSPRLRATLIGKAVGDTYSVLLDEAAEGSAHRIPLYGLADASSAEPRYRGSLQPVLEIDRRYT
jgi:hypothetical protein